MKAYRAWHTPYVRIIILLLVILTKPGYPCVGENLGNLMQIQGIKRLGGIKSKKKQEMKDTGKNVSNP